MKQFVLALGLCLTSSFANAMVPHPWNDGRLLEKNQVSGFVPEHLSFHIHCVIYADKVVVDYQKAWDLTKHIEYKTQIAAGTNHLIAKAANGIITKRMAPADIGNTEYYAYAESPLTTVNQIDLGSIFDSRYISENQAPEAKELKKFIDTTCEDAKNM